MAKTLLLADDSVTIQKVVGISFASEDIAITTVDNGDDALAKAREMHPDIILADVVMPGLSGYEVCEAVKADPSLSHIPVVLLTGTFEAFDEERASRAGAAGHVAKPFEAQTLVERVKALVSQAPAPIPTPRPAAPATPTAPAPSADATGSGQSFDFFDEPAAAPAGPAAPAASAPADELDVEGPDGAFAFGEDDLSGTTDPGARAGVGSAAPPDPPAHTVAILPDPPAAPPSAEGSPPPVPGGAGRDDGFDFEFEGVRTPSSADGGADLDALADEAQLDPGTSAFDVSSSELGDLDELSQSAVQPVAAPPVAPTQLLERPQADPEPSADDISSPEMLAPDSASPGLAADPAAGLGGADPVETGPIESNAAFIEDLPTEAPRADFDVAEPLPTPTDEAPELWPSEAQTLPPVDAPPSRDTILSESDLETEPDVPEREPEPLAAPPETASDSLERMTDEALGQIAPALRSQLHETLEKIAWESFGEVAEQIVEQAVERVEKITWEVVPKLAETLIQEELRKLKGE